MKWILSAMVFCAAVIGFSTVAAAGCGCENGGPCVCALNSASPIMSQPTQFYYQHHYRPRRVRSTVVYSYPVSHGYSLIPQTPAVWQSTATQTQSGNVVPPPPSVANPINKAAVAHSQIMKPTGRELHAANAPESVSGSVWVRGEKLSNGLWRFVEYGS